jgi:hypothetical protein
MPLVNSPTLTPKKLAANRANAQLSRGPITLEGLNRVRDSNIKHGTYAQDTEEALRVLGEDPKDYDVFRREDSSFRQVGRLIDLLTKLKRDAWHAENKKNNIKNEGESHDVVDNKTTEFPIPRCCRKQSQLTHLSHDIYENAGT